MARLANRATVSIDTSADMACQYLLALSPRERLRKSWGTLWTFLAYPMICDRTFCRLLELNLAQTRRQLRRMPINPTTHGMHNLHDVDLLGELIIEGTPVLRLLRCVFLTRIC